MKKIILILLLFLSACTYKYEPKKASDEIRIMITSDTHFIDSSLQGKLFDEAQILSDGKLSKYSEVLTDKFIDEAILNKPDFVIINGDLTYNGEKISHKELSKKLDRLLDNKIMPLVIPGNHDILNAHTFDYSKDEIYYTDFINVDEFKEIYQDKGYKDAFSYDPNSLSYIYKASDALWLIMLDSNTYENNSNFAPSSIGTLKKETLTWLDETLSQKNKDTNAIIFMHHPLIDISNTPSYVLTNNEDLFKIINRYQIPLTITGHIHAQNYKEIELDNIIHTNLGISSLAVYRHQYTNLIFKDNKIETSSTALNLQDYINDPFFTDFNDKAKEYFKIYSTNRLKGLYDGDDIPKELSNVLFDLKGEFNIYSFSGQGYKLNDLLINNNHYDEILKYKDSYAKELFISAKVFNKDSTKLSIDLKSVLK